MYEAGDTVECIMPSSRHPFFVQGKCYPVVAGAGDLDATIMQAGGRIRHYLHGEEVNITDEEGNVIFLKLAAGKVDSILGEFEIVG